LKVALFILLGLFAAGYATIWITTQIRSKATAGPGDPAAGTPRPGWTQTAIGFVTNFFDTLGIGSFAPTTSIYKLLRLVPDELIPGTMNVGHTLPVVVQAFIYISIIDVEPLTLSLMIAASILGAWLGAGIVSGLPRRPIQIAMGIALIVAAALMAMTQFNLFPLGGEDLGLTGALLAAAMVGNFALGAFNTIGIGLYAPCMIMISLLGMNPQTAFPIMMGSCAFLMPVGSARFVRKRKFSLRPAIGLTLGGIPAVLLAAFIVKSLPLGALRWLVVVVVAYTAVMMLRSARARTPESVPTT
jgi:uncharacterized membrane protein YfcA